MNISFLLCLFFRRGWVEGGGLSCRPFGECPVPFAAPLRSALQVGSQCHCNDYCQCQPLFWSGRRWPGWKISLSHWLWIELTWLYLAHMTDNPSPLLLPHTPARSIWFVTTPSLQEPGKPGPSPAGIEELFLYIFAYVKRDRLLSTPGRPPRSIRAPPRVRGGPMIAAPSSPGLDARACVGEANLIRWPRYAANAK